MTFFYLVLAAVAVAFAIDAFNRRRIRHLQQSGVYPPPGQGGAHDVERLVALGRKIDAIKLYRQIGTVDLTVELDRIKLYRQIHRTDLKTAKKAVDELADRADLRQR